MYVFLCEDSPEGIFTGVYNAWESRLGHNNISLQIHTREENYDLLHLPGCHTGFTKE